MRFSELAGRRVGVWGAGREGLAAQRALSAQEPDRQVLVYTDKPVPTEDRARFQGRVAFASGDEGFDSLTACEVVIRSPGVSRYRPDVEGLAGDGVTVTTGTNLWFAEHGDERIVAVTGTKGKSTTATLIAHLLNRSGTRAVLCGNAGFPLLDHLHEDPLPDVWVLELSSFQASDLERGPSIGVLLNIHPEHLDWHGTPERYLADKLNMLTASPGTLAILNRLEPRVAGLAPRLEDVRWFGGEQELHVDVAGAIRDGLGDVLYEPGTLRLRGRHNALNACAALTAVAELGLDPAALPEPLASFQPLPHRLEPVGTFGGRSFVNDSISTTPAAAMAALDALSGDRIALIAGGYERGQDYTALGQRIADARNVDLVVGLPDTGKRIVAEVEKAAAAHVGPTGHGAPATRLAADIDEAVRVAAAGVPVDGVVLLSPAAPSYVQFKDFEERGAAFRLAAAHVEEAA
ncbi:MAG: UDP-N-acetylmuramoyl-L-alanine---L-glutamate ligase [Thermoleophilaceae bacterium]|nr:UDP-N-acetylmuramoyl-L-alanine---L-glutamate ligase [Thermoleophilaceae bacterium]